MLPLQGAGHLRGVNQLAEGHIYHQPMGIALGL
jgi:hypothetical protein